MATKIVLIRHGVTRWNKEKRYCGCMDIGLSKEGKAQAEKLKKHLSGNKFHKIYSSDRKRALQTAKIIFKGLKLIQVKGLREMSFGVMEGLRHDDILKKYPKEYSRWLENPFKYNIPKAEALVDFKKRVNCAIRKIVDSNRGKTVAVVCHGGAIGIFVTGILKKKDFWRHVPKTTSVTIVEFMKNKPKIKLFNAASHLE
ncbi:MAG: histidine phosphatase family protein [Candidatus Omnitrophica bacterium]|nr:histidine phosphatase family protein [Candidatus Omnitrophota bacterium]